MEVRGRRGEKEEAKGGRYKCYMHYAGEVNRKGGKENIVGAKERKKKT